VWTALLRLSEDKNRNSNWVGGECKFSESASLGFEMKNRFSGVLTKGRSHCGGVRCRWYRVALATLSLFLLLGDNTSHT